MLLLSSIALRALLLLFDFCESSWFGLVWSGMVWFDLICFAMCQTDWIIFYSVGSSNVWIVCVGCTGCYRKVNVCSVVEGTPKGVQKHYASISQSGLRFLYANYGSSSRPQKTDVSQIVAKHSRRTESAYRGNSPFQGTINSLEYFLPLNWCYAYA